jgi:hypothetical protein
MSDQIVKFFSDYGTMIMGFLFFLSEALAEIPQVKANSLFQLVFGLLKKNQPPSA